MVPTPILSLEDEINKEEADTSPVIFKAVNVPKDVTLGWAAVVSLPPSSVAVTVVELTVTMLPVVESIEVPLILDPVSSVNCATDEEIPTEDVRSPVTVNVDPSKSRFDWYTP